MPSLPPFTVLRCTKSFILEKVFSVQVRDEVTRLVKNRLVGSEPWWGRESFWLLCILYSIGSVPFVTRTTQVPLNCSCCFGNLSLSGDRVWSGKTWLRVLALPLSSCINLGKSLNLCDSSFPYLENGTNTSCFTGQLKRIKYDRRGTAIWNLKHDSKVVAAAVIWGEEVGLHIRSYNKYLIKRFSQSGTCRHARWT